MIETSPELSTISKVTAFISLFLWTLTWLPKPLVLTSPRDSLFDVLFSAPYMHGRFVTFAAWISLAAHVIIVCLQTGFVLNGIESPAIYEMWMVPDGDFKTYAVVVGIPCAAFAALTVATVVRMFAPDTDALTGAKKWIVWALCAPSGLLVTFVFFVNYVEQLIYRASVCEGYVHEIAALAYYGFVIFFIAESYWLYYSSNKKLKKMLKQKQEHKQGEAPKVNKHNEKKGKKVKKN